MPLFSLNKMATEIFIYSWLLKWQMRDLQIGKRFFASQYLKGQWWHEEGRIELPLLRTPVPYQDCSAATVQSSPAPCPGWRLDERLQSCSLPQREDWSWWACVMLILHLWVMIWRRPVGAEVLSGCFPSSALWGRHPGWMLTGGKGFSTSRPSSYM